MVQWGSDPKEIEKPYQTKTQSFKDTEMLLPSRRSRHHQVVLRDRATIQQAPENRVAADASTPELHLAGKHDTQRPKDDGSLGFIFDELQGTTKVD